MLVYSTVFWIQKSSTFNGVLSLVADWLSRKTRSRVAAESLHRNDDRRMQDGSRIETVTALDAFPVLSSTRYSHPDSDVSGRLWVTEIGLRHQAPDSEIECTVLLETKEISALVSGLGRPTRPKVVPEIVQKSSVSERTCGVKVKELDEESVEDFRYLVEDERRRQPLVLVSPTPSGAYKVDPERLCSLLMTVADTIRIPQNADTRYIAHVLGNEYAAWRGAVNLIFPAVRGRQFIPTHRIMPDELDEVLDSGRTPEDHVFLHVVHRTNLPNSWRHISSDFVKEARLLRELSRKRAEASQRGELTEYVHLLEETNNEYKGRIEKSTEEVNSWKEMYLAIDEEKRKLSFDNANLKVALTQVGKESEDGELGVSEQERLAIIMKPNPKPEEALRVVSVLFPDRVAVLGSAWKSCKKSVEFKQGSKLLDLLLILVTRYWESLTKGKGGDATARHVFGNSYAPRESETVENNKRARGLRTFDYKGQPIEMMKHLKIGNKPSAAETIRVHFEWLPEEKKIILGHCGPHPDHK